MLQNNSISNFYSHFFTSLYDQTSLLYVTQISNVRCLIGIIQSRVTKWLHLQLKTT